MGGVAQKVIVIAAGMGRRLRPHTDDMPKCLVPVGERPMLAWQLDAFRAHGVREFVIIRGYKGDVLQARAGELGGGIRFVDNTDFRNNNILLSLFCAEHEIEGDLCVTYGDIVYTEEVVSQLLGTDADIALVIDHDFRKMYEGRTQHPLTEAEVAGLGEKGLVRCVGKRALPADEAVGEFIGLAKFSAQGSIWLRDAWRELSRQYSGREHQAFQRATDFSNAYLTDMLQHLIDAGRPVVAVPIHGDWREIDTTQDLERARAMLSQTKPV